MEHPMKIFGLEGSEDYAQQVAEHLGIELTPVEENVFEDGECYVKPTSKKEGNVRGHNVFVVSSLFSDDKYTVNDRFVKLCIFSGACRTGSAYQVIPVIPYLAWTRQDRKTVSRAPVTTRIRAEMMKSVGVDRLVLMDVHNLAAEQNAFGLDCPIDCLESKNLHAEFFAEKFKDFPKTKITVVSPDGGGVSRVERFIFKLSRLLKRDDIEMAVFDKRRRKDGSIEGSRIIGDVEDSNCIIYDDMISTAGTMINCAVTVEKFGGKVYALAASHGLFVGSANESLSKIGSKIVISNTLPPFRLSEENQKRLNIVDTTSLVAEAIQRINSGTGSISSLL